MRRVAVAGVLVAAVVASVVVVALPEHQTGRAVPDSAVPALRQIAASFASNNGDPGAARTAVAVLAAHQTALSAEGSTADGGGQDVYLVQMLGSFTGYEAKVPSGGSLPEGGVLWFDVDAKSYTMLDWGLSGTAPDLSRLGSVRSLGTSST